MKRIFSENKGKIILSSVVICLPFFASLVMNAKVFFIPFIMLAVQWIGLLITGMDKKNVHQTKKAIGMVIWILPILSILYGTIYLLIQKHPDASRLIMVVLYFAMGFLFLFIGNYLPKVRRNTTIGIKVKWALADDENWNATHRFGGKVWVICGIVCMACALISGTAASVVIFAAAIAAAAAFPIGYSRAYYKKQLQAGKVEEIKNGKRAKIITLVITAGVVVFVIWVLFTGSMSIAWNSDSFTVKTPNWGDLTLKYQEIESVRLVPESLNTKSVRTNGYGNLKMSIGSFSGDYYGNYTRYTYNSCDSYVELNADGRIIVLNGENESETEEIYRTLLEKIKQ